MKFQLSANIKIKLSHYRGDTISIRYHWWLTYKGMK